MFRQNPGLLLLQKKLDEEYAKQAGSRKKSLPPPYTLPVVFHVVHGGGAENISRQRILDGLAHVNEAFANQGFYDRGTGVATGIQFCLAERTPDNQPTDGVTRRSDPLTDLAYQTQDRDLKALVQWEPTEYINIYVVREICRGVGTGCNVAGYAYYPSAHGRAMDGIVMEARWLGSSQANAGVLVHELGHYLGLRHTFDGGCTNDDCTRDGDAVCDTPPDGSTAAVPCSGSVNSCTTDTDSGFASDQDDLFINYMDYGRFSCYSAFTAGQRDRMYFFLEGRRRSLLRSFGCSPPCPTPVVAGFTGGETTVEVGDNVTFMNTSAGNDRNEWRVDGIPAGNAPNLNRTFTTEGVYTVQLVVSSNDPLCAPDSVSRLVRVVCPVEPNFTSAGGTAGDPITFVNVSTGGGTPTWRVDGNVVGTDPDLTYVFPAGGVYDVCLTMDNGACAEERCRRVFVFAPSGGGGGQGSDSCGYRTSLFYEAKVVTRDPLRDNHSLQAVALAGDGGYFVGGQYNDLPFVTRLAPDGTPVWSTQLFPGAARSRVFYLTQDADGFLAGLVSGVGMPQGGNDESVQAGVFKINPLDGSLEWARQITSPRNLSLKKLFQPSGGADYVVIGERGSTSSANLLRNGFRATFDSNTGNPSAPPTDYDTFNLSSYDDAYYDPTSGELRLTGLGGLPDRSGVRFVRLDATGAVIEDRLLHTAPTFESSRQLIAADGDGSVVAYDLVEPNGDRSVFVQRLDERHNTVWTRRVERPGTDDTDFVRALVVNSTGYLVMESLDISNHRLVQLDRDGNIVWAQTQNTYSINEGTHHPLIMSGDEITVVGNVLGYAGNPAIKRLDSVGLSTDTCITVSPRFRQVSPLTPPQSPYVSVGVPSEMRTFRFGAEPFNFNLEFSCGEPCVEICDNDLDDDRDGAIDCDDDDLALNCCCLPGPAADLGRDNFPFCGRTSINFTPDDPSYQLLWSTGSTSNLISIEEPGTYAITVTDTCGRSAADTLVIYPRTPPSIDLGPDTTVCENAVVTYRVPPGFIAYEWSDGSTDSTFTTFEAGEFWLSALDSCGTEVRDTVRVIFEPTTRFDLGRDTTICRGDTLRFCVPGYSDYQWSKSTFLDCDDCPEVRFAPTEDTLLLLTATARPGCFSFDSIRVRVRTEPGRRDTFSLCSGDFLNLADTVIRTSGLYTFTPAGLTCARVDTAVVQLLPEASSLDTAFICTGEELLVFGRLIDRFGDYRDTLVATNGCDSVLTLRVLPLQLDTAVFDTAFICPGDTLFLPDTILTEPGDYTVRYPWARGCDSVVTTTLRLREAPLLTLPPVLRVTLGDSVRVRPGGDLPDTTRFLWRNETDGTEVIATTLRLRPTSTQTWTASATDPAGGCPVMAPTRIEATPGDLIYVPSAFSPNADGVNDRFWPGFGPAVETVEELSVYDRWGARAYHVEQVPAFLVGGADAGATVGWNGNGEDGRVAAVGVYVYTLRVRLFTGAVVERSGEVLVLR